MAKEKSKRPERRHISQDSSTFRAFLIRVINGEFDDFPPIDQKRIAKILGISEGVVSRKLHDEKRKFTLNEIEKVCEYLYVSHKIFNRDRVSVIDDALYFSLLEFFEIKQPSQDNAVKLLSGVYELWRYSVEHDDEFVRGKLVFSEHKSGAFKVSMTQKERKKSQDGLLNEELYEGYMIRIADMYVMLLRDVASMDLRVTYFPKYRVEFIDDKRTNKRIIHMDGFGMGVDGNNLFISPVHIFRLESEGDVQKLNDGIDVVEESDSNVDKRVIKKLKKFPRILR